MGGNPGRPPKGVLVHQMQLSHKNNRSARRNVHSLSYYFGLKSVIFIFSLKTALLHGKSSKMPILGFFELKY